jgi:hypothetical protein
MGDGRPRCPKLGTEREDCQDSVVKPLRKKLAQELESGRINPMQILNDEEDGLLL